MSADKMPPLPDTRTLGSSRYGSLFKGYIDADMHAYARAYAAEQTRELVQILEGWVWARQNGASEELAEQWAIQAIAKHKEQA